LASAISFFWEGASWLWAARVMPSDADSAVKTWDHLRNFTATSSYGRDAMSLYLTSAVEAGENQSMLDTAGVNFRVSSLRLLRPAAAVRLAHSAAAAQLLPYERLRAIVEIRSRSTEVVQRRCRRSGG
jgi:hypothetical protein